MGVVVREPVISAVTTYRDPSKPNAPQHFNAYASTLTAAQRELEGRYRIAAETPPSHVGLMGLLFPWAGGPVRGINSNNGILGGLSVKLGMLNWRHSAVFIALPRDRTQASNRISIDSAGEPVIHYACTKPDEMLVLAGLEMNVRYLRAAGARFIYIAHEQFPWHYCGSTGKDDNEEERFEEFIKAFRKEGLKTARMQIFSAHQMGSCRMAPTPVTGPTSPSGELYECTNLFVADASVFPSSLGINPMVTIESISHMISKNVIARLQSGHPALEKKMRDFQAQQRAASAANQW